MNEAILQYNFDKLVMNDAVEEGLHRIRDYRIRVTSSRKISIVCYVYDLKSLANLFLGYLFSIAKSRFFEQGMITIHIPALALFQYIQLEWEAIIMRFHYLDVVL